MDCVIHRYESLCSTNDEAARLADAGAPEGTVVIAREQTAGRGRYGRTWASPAGEGLSLSVVLRPDLPFEQLWQLGFVAAVASAEAISQASRLCAQIKWPNDVRLGGKKVCGILVEAKPSPINHQPLTIDHSPSAVVGIGINVNNQAFPPDIADKATSIALEVGHPAAVEEIEAALLSCLGTWYDLYLRDGFPPILDGWREYDCTVGRHVSVRSGEGVIEGVAVEVTAEGDLAVRTASGRMAYVASGEATVQ